MSTFAHVMSFPFFFFGIIFLIATFTNSLTLHFGDMKRKATFHERIGFAIIGFLLLSIAYYMTQA